MESLDAEADSVRRDLGLIASLADHNLPVLLRGPRHGDAFRVLRWLYPNEIVVAEERAFLVVGEQVRAFRIVTADNLVWRDRDGGVGLPMPVYDLDVPPARPWWRRVLFGRERAS